MAGVFVMRVGKKWGGRSKTTRSVPARLSASAHPHTPKSVHSHVVQGVGWARASPGTHRPQDMNTMLTFF